MRKLFRDYRPWMMKKVCTPSLHYVSRDPEWDFAQEEQFLDREALEAAGCLSRCCTTTRGSTSIAPPEVVEWLHMGVRMTAAVEDESLPWAAAWQRKEAEKIQELENSKKDSIHTCEAAGLPGYNDYETWPAKERLLVPVIQERAVCDKPRAYPEAGRKALERKRLDEVGRRTVLLLESVRREVTVDEELDMEAYRASRRRFDLGDAVVHQGGDPEAGEGDKAHQGGQ